jgi:outer membrane receptor protein involved in Fe transport
VLYRLTIRHCVSLALALHVAMAGAAHATTVGQSIEAAIGEFASSGLRIFYSSDLVLPSMMVTVKSASSDPVAQLNEILAPHGLTLRPGLNDAWLVVRRPGASPPTRAVGNFAAARDEPEPPPKSLPSMEEVVVSASRYEIQGARTQAVHQIGNLELAHSPDIGDDAIRSVARLPGVAASSFSARVNVRGGENRDTLIRLDGIQLYDPFHLRDFEGVFSIIDPRIVSAIDVYTGGLPAQFGDRIAGVIEIETIEPPRDLYHELGVSFFNTSILSAGRFSHAAGEWVASARRSNLDLLYDRFSDQPERPGYTDLFAKLHFDIGENLGIAGSVLRAADSIELADDIDREERASARQTDTYAWLALDHRLGGRTSGTTTMARTAIDAIRLGTSAKTGVSTGRLSDVRSFSIQTLRSDWLRVVGSRSMLEFGAELSDMAGSYRYDDEVVFDLLFDIDGAPGQTSRVRALSTQIDGRKFALFANLRIDPTPRLTTELGFRWTEQTLAESGATTLGPRLGVRYSLSDGMSVRASWGRYFQHQSINEFSVGDGDLRVYEPERSDQFVAGFDRQLGGRTILRIEAYSKAMNDLRPRFENLLDTRILLPELKPDRLGIAPDSARARGIEISLDGTFGAFDWWGGLARARVDDRIAGRRVPRSWDQEYALNAGFDLGLERWNLSTALAYRSGWPTTSVSLATSSPVPTAHVAARNDARMRPFVSADIRVSRRIPLDRSELTVFLEIANLTGRKNPCCFEYEIGDEEDTGLLVLDERHHLPTIPSLGFSWAF